MTTTQASFTELFPITLNYFKDGFEHTKTQVKPILKLLIPMFIAMIALGIVAVIIIIPIAILNPEAMNSMKSEDPEAVLQFLFVFLPFFIIFFITISLFSLYYQFVQARFTVQSYQTADLSLKQIWALDKSIWGFIGLVLLTGFIGIPVAVIGLIVALFTFFLLGIPGFCILGLYHYFQTVSIFSYFENPSAGVFAALSKGWTLITTDWQRWLVLFLIVAGAYIVITVPIMIISIIPVLGDLVQLAMNIASCVVGVYLFFVYFRCYQDSKAALIAGKN